MIRMFANGKRYIRFLVIILDPSMGNHDISQSVIHVTYDGRCLNIVPLLKIGG